VERVISEHPATYVGDEFPSLGNGNGPASDFAVISFRAEETTNAFSFRLLSPRFGF